MIGRRLNLLVVLYCVGSMVRWISGLQVLVGVKKVVCSSIGMVWVRVGADWAVCVGGCEVAGLLMMGR